jgi:hypothetical protein
MPPAADGLPSESTIKSWLHGGDPRLVAWGAHDALVAHDRDLMPDLLSLAGQWQPLSRQNLENSTELPPEQADERVAMVAVLEALIQMNVPVPADTLRTLAPDFGNAAAILLSRMSPEEAGPLAFEFYRSYNAHGYGLQYVSAALLALHPTPGFAAHLLADIGVQASVHVVPPGWEQSVIKATTDGSCFSLSEIPRNDWPVIGQYALSKQKSDGAMLLVAGIDPIYATRKQSAEYLGDVCSMSWGVALGSGERFRLIAEMLSIPPQEIRWQTRPETYVEFHSPQQFDNDLLAFVQEQQAMYRATVASLAAHNLLTPLEAEQCLPELDLHLIDERGNGAIPIPKRSDLPAHVEWSDDWWF